MKSGRSILIVSNNPLAVEILGKHYQFYPMLEQDARDVLLHVRDKVYLGQSLLTHPLSGSIKPNETPYKSIVISREPGKAEPDEIETIANAITAWDKFSPRNIQYDKKAVEDFQLIDYTLLCGALDYDAVAGLQQRDP